MGVPVRGRVFWMSRTRSPTLKGGSGSSLALGGRPGDGRAAGRAGAAGLATTAALVLVEVDGDVVVVGGHGVVVVVASRVTRPRRRPRPHVGLVDLGLGLTGLAGLTVDRLGGASVSPLGWSGRSWQACDVWA